MALLLVACRREPQATPDPHYVTGASWQADGRWFYPREDFAWQDTGLAVRDHGQDGELTADGEVRDSMAMTGAHQTLQLPAIVSVTNLENGREVVVRLNDRGPAQAGRMLSLSARAADLLGMGEGPARVRVVENEAESRRLAEILPGAPKLEISAAPREGVTQTDLSGQGSSTVGMAVQAGDAATPKTGLTLPALPAEVRQGWAAPGMLWVEVMDLTSRYSAMVQAARYGGVIRPDLTAGHGMMWAVRFGPFTTIQDADSALRRALAAGLTGSHIVVE
ncbi:MAG: RlpA-like double-psi beta-barrel domain-containing protein [Acetobacter papayae]